MDREYAVEFIVDIAKGLHSLETIAHILNEHSEER
jgi:death-on-curing protein